MYPDPDKPVLLKRRTPQITNYKHQMSNKFPNHNVKISNKIKSHLINPISS